MEGPRGQKEAGALYDELHSAAGVYTRTDAAGQRLIDDVEALKNGGWSQQTALRDI